MAVACIPCHLCLFFLNVSPIDAVLQATHVEVVDTSSGCGTSFEVVVVSPIFVEKKGLLQKHRVRINMNPSFTACFG